MNSKFFVHIPVKPYVMRYLEINFGNPVNFSSVPEHERYFLKLLRKKSNRDDNKYDKNMFKYSDIVEVIISRDDFMRYGFELSRTDVIKFGKHFEGLIKLTARTYIQFKRGLVGLNEAIIEYQTLFGLPEDFWSFESIKKDIYRNGANVDIDFKNEINKSMNKLFLENLINSNVYLASKNGLKYYLEKL